jgi:hypothetical protein
MCATWHYGNVTLEIKGTLVHDGKRYVVPMHGGESPYHALLKVSIAAHLLVWGYDWECIHWEKTPIKSIKEFRPDLYVEGNERLPSFWFECIGTDRDKLHQLVIALPNCRIVRVISDEHFKQFWNGTDTCVIDGKVLQTSQISDWKQRKRLVIQERESFVAPGTECWAIRAGEYHPRIIWAVRHGFDGRFTYLDSAEGWTLSSFRYIPKRKEYFEPLIPGIVGSTGWTGKSQAYYETQGVEDPR